MKWLIPVLLLGLVACASVGTPTPQMAFQHNDQIFYCATYVPAMQIPGEEPILLINETDTLGCPEVTHE